MKLNSLALLFLLVGFSNATAQWELRYPNLPEDKVTAITFTSESHGFFANEAGTIYKTTDSGQSWKEVFYNKNSEFTDIQFIDDQIGFAYGYLRTSFIYTTNGGESWSEDDLDIHMALSVLGFSPSEFLKTDANGIYKTTSVYGEWDQIYSIPQDTFDYGDMLAEEPIYTPHSTQQLNDSSLVILFYNSYRGEYLNKTDSLHYLMFSYNRGTSWDSIWVNIEGKVTSFEMIDENTGYFLTQGGHLYKTTDGGKNWDQKEIPNTEIAPHSIVVFSADRIYLKGAEVLKSVDGGNNWSVLQVPENSFNTGYLISKHDLSLIHDLQLKVLEEGEEWVHGKQYQRITGNNLYFKDKTTGWSYSFNQDSTYKTEDGGFTWVSDPSFPEPLNEIYYRNEQTGWIITQNSIYKTEDDGESWTNLNLLEKEEQLYDAHILFDGQFGILYWNVNCEELTCGYLFITTNGGDTWEEREVPTYFKSLSVTSNKVFGVNNNKELWVTTDNAESWEISYDYSHQNLSPKPLVRSIQDMVWLNIGFKTLAYSKDSGATWKTTSAEVDEDMSLIGPFTKGNYYLYVPGRGNILQINTELGVYDKRHQQINTQVGLEDITYVLDEENIPHIWVRGNYNTVLYRKGPLSVSVSNNVEMSGIPKSTELYQNHPNPFNPSTTFSFKLSEAGNVELSIFNMIGQKVSIVQNNKLSAGYHTINFNASSLASGTYIYQLRTNNEVLSKKFILIK